MKSKNKKELKIKTIQELKSLLKETKDNLFSLKLQKEQNKLKNLRSIFIKRREIAQILTVLKAKEVTA